jgi:hypothetical protein
MSEHDEIASDAVGTLALCPRYVVQWRDIKAARRERTKNV